MKKYSLDMTYFKRDMELGLYPSAELFAVADEVVVSVVLKFDENLILEPRNCKYNPLGNCDANRFKVKYNSFVTYGDLKFNRLACQVSGRNNSIISEYVELSYHLEVGEVQRNYVRFIAWGSKRLDEIVTEFLSIYLIEV